MTPKSSIDLQLLLTEQHTAQTQVYFNQMIFYQQDGTCQAVSQPKTFLRETESVQREADTSFRCDQQMTNSVFQNKQKKEQKPMWTAGITYS